MAAPATDPLGAVAQLQQVVQTLAPVLRPQVLPKGANYGLDLVLSLCKTPEQKQQLRALVQSERPSDAPTDDGDDDSKLQPQAVGAFDVENKVFNVEKVVWMTPQDAAIHEFARFLELQLEHPGEAAPVLAHFLEVNGRAPDDVLAAQQCFNAAFALQTVLRAFPRPPFAISGVPLEIDEHSDVATVFAPLFRSTKAGKKGAADKSSSNKSNNRSKSKKRKN
ncbi:hypothetical protein PybrP1_008827 [[Pythium] brassicae (nom. inval.)]|nr:hypothetical protein PybrP1_008827 [[Pythium] brassicae (nom. inval.)]